MPSWRESICCAYFPIFEYRSNYVMRATTTGNKTHLHTKPKFQRNPDFISRMSRLTVPKFSPKKLGKCELERIQFESNKSQRDISIFRTKQSTLLEYIKKCILLDMIWQKDRLSGLSAK